jgi:hypothetical protein
MLYGMSTILPYTREFKYKLLRCVFLVHPPNVQLHNFQVQNVQVQNVHLPNGQLQNVQVTKRPGYQTSRLQNVQDTKHPVFVNFKLCLKITFSQNMSEIAYLMRSMR